MPLKNSLRRISPLDLNRNLTLGVAFPLDEKNTHNGTKTEREQIKTNLVQLLLTQRGELLHKPDYGVGLKKLLFEPGVNLQQLSNNINQQITYYLPQITLLNVTSDFFENENTLFIKVVYKYNLDESEDAIGLNINPTAGNNYTPQDFY